MKLVVSIGGVDNSHTHCTTDNLKAAGGFLELLDHEGSAVGVTVEAHGEDAYRLLALLDRAGELLTADQRRADVVKEVEHLIAVNDSDKLEEWFGDGFEPATFHPAALTQEQVDRLHFLYLD